MDLDGTAVGLDQLAGDGEAQTAAGTLAVGAGPVGAPEAIEDVGHIFGRNPLARVGYDQAHTLRPRPTLERHGAAFRRVADGVGQQVAKHLLEPAVIAAQAQGGCAGGVLRGQGGEGVDDEVDGRQPAPAR